MFSYPWNQTTFLGYSGEVVGITIFGNEYSAILFVLVFLFVSICLHHQAFAKMFKLWVYEWNRHGDANAEKFLCNLIRFHISIKE